MLAAVYFSLYMIEQTNSGKLHFKYRICCKRYTTCNRKMISFDEKFANTRAISPHPGRKCQFKLNLTVICAWEISIGEQQNFEKSIICPTGLSISFSPYWIQLCRVDTQNHSVDINLYSGLLTI